MRRVLFDSDVLIDVLSRREPFLVASSLALSSTIRDNVEAYVAGHAVTNIFYILRRQIGNQATREVLTQLLQRLRVASVTDEIIRQALSSPIADFEDAVTSAAASSAQVEQIVTRNLSDFLRSDIPAVSPEMFLTSL